MIFGGKFAFGSTDNTRPQMFLESFRSVDRHDHFPGMAASAQEDPGTTCILTTVDNGTLIQILSDGSLKYLSVGRLGWIVFGEQQADAAVFLISDDAEAQTWSVLIEGKPVQVGYALGNSPLLTVNPNPYTTFVARQITPPLSVILKNKSGAGMDFGGAALGGQDLTGIDFTGASFAGAVLGGTIFDSCLLNGAHFESAILVEASFDGATLDGATFRGPTTDLSQVQWGRVKSAPGIDLSGCSAKGTQLGGAVIDCHGANLSGANFSGANLSYLNLAQCNAANAILAEGCDCNHAILDDADLSNLMAVRGNFASASLQRVKADGAVFFSSDLSNADLSQGQFGAKVFLFGMSESLVPDFDGNAFVTPAIISAFQTNGKSLSPRAAIDQLTTGLSWRVLDPVIGRFSVLNNADQTALNVFQPGAGTPAVFTGATMAGTIASGAGLAAADLTGVSWTSGKGDHTDLETAVLCGALLLETDFTQAQIYGANFVDSVLIQAKLNGCTIGPGEDGQPTNFSRAQMHGTEFADATLFDVLLGGAAVASSHGVPLFTMPLSYEADLTEQNLPALLSYFSGQGYPLSANTTIGLQAAWSIDNSSDSEPRALTAFFIWNKTDHLAVYDGTTSTFLFTLPENLLAFLQEPGPSRQLISAFSANSYDLAATAIISPAAFWQLTNSPNGSAQVTYQFIKIVKQSDGLHVYGTTTLWLAGYPQFTTALAFGPTLHIQSALNPASICPNGYARAALEDGLFTWEELLTVRA
jgi:uncharacterized protein YjbI with pentapeptide repeats